MGSAYSEADNRGNNMDADRQVEANHNRRMANESRMIDRWDALAAREEKARGMVGELVRDGKTVHYVSLVGGKYREGRKWELVEFLVRNNYV